MTTHALYVLIAVSAGSLLAAKSGFNARLGVLTRDTLLATSAGLFAAFVCVGGLLALSTQEAPRSDSLAGVPPYLWVAGGALTAAASLSVYWLIPRFGITSVIALGLAGQLVTSLVAAHLGWFGMPRSEVTIPKLLGAVAVLAGAFALTHDSAPPQDRSFHGVS